MINLALLKNPVNWVIVWSMLLIGLFLYHQFKKSNA